MAKGRKPAPLPTKEQILAFIRDSPKPVWKTRDRPRLPDQRRRPRPSQGAAARAEGRGRRRARRPSPHGALRARCPRWRCWRSPSPIPTARCWRARSSGRRRAAAHDLHGAGPARHAGSGARRAGAGPPRRRARRHLYRPRHPPYRRGAEAGDRHLRADCPRAAVCFRPTGASAPISASPEPTPRRGGGRTGRSREALHTHRLGMLQAQVVERLGHIDDPRSVSLIAIHDTTCRPCSPPRSLAEARAARPVSHRRADRPARSLPLVTIDGADARDFDDAVWAEPDADAGNPGGWHLLVAIADVAHYVRPGSAARPGRPGPRQLAPTSPTASCRCCRRSCRTACCSLAPEEDRACLAAHLWIDAEGQPARHRFERGLMRSAARLTYEQVQAARDGRARRATANPLARQRHRPALRRL